MSYNVWWNFMYTTFYLFYCLSHAVSFYVLCQKWRNKDVQSINQSSSYKTAHGHWPHVNVCRVSCGGVVNMLLLLSITSYFHYNIWGCMCSTGHFSIGDWKDVSIAHVIIIIESEVSTLPIIIIFSVVVCLRCLLHHILLLISYAFRENREFIFIIIVQFMMSANNRRHFVLKIVFVCLYITPSHYHHYANLSEDIELKKMPVRYILSSVWVR